MDVLAHLSYPYLVANLIALLFGVKIPIEYNLVLLMFSFFPDADYAVNFLTQLVQKGKYKVPTKHHVWPSHWPIVYTPIFVVALITLEPFFLIASGALIVHFIMDMFYCNTGIMWFYPFSKKWHIFLSDTTKGKGGLAWNKAYNKLLISKIDKVAFLLFILHLTIFFIL